MDSPSPTSLNCMSICNNNLFSGNRSYPESYPPIDSVDHLNKSNVLNSFKHPGQAVKIITDSLGEHTIVKCREDSDNEVRSINTAEHRHYRRENSLKTSQSCTNFDIVDRDKWSVQSSKSNGDLKGYKSCDENLIRFIFTKHGIQVISDVETVV